MSSSAISQLLTLCRRQLLASSAQQQQQGNNNNNDDSLLRWNLEALLVKPTNSENDNNNITNESKQQLITAIVGADKFHEVKPDQNGSSFSDKIQSLRQSLVSVDVKISPNNNNNIRLYRNSKSFFDDSVARILQQGPLNRLRTLAKENNIDYVNELRPKAETALLSAFDLSFEDARRIVMDGDVVRNNNSNNNNNASRGNGPSYPEVIKTHLRLFALVSLLSAGAIQTINNILSECETNAKKQARASGNGNVKSLFKQLCESAPKVLDGLSLEMFAAQNGNTNLLDSVMNENETVFSTFSPQDLLCFAVRGGHLTCVSFIINEFFGKNKNNIPAVIPFSPIQVASETGNMDIINEIIAIFHQIPQQRDDEEKKYKPANLLLPFFSPLFLAAKNGNSKVISYLVESHYEFLVQLQQESDKVVAEKLDSKEAQDQVGASPLHVAAVNGQTDAFITLILQHQLISKKLLTANAQQPVEVQNKSKAATNAIFGTLDAKDPRTGKTPLHFAATFDRVGIIEKHFSVAAGKAIRDPLDNCGNTPLMDACRAGAEASCTLLIRFGAAVNFCNTDPGTAPLHEAVLGNHCGAVKILLRAGANINLLTLGSGCSPLHLAAQCGHDAVMRVILRFWKAKQQQQQQQQQKSGKKTEDAIDELPNILATKDEVKGRTALHFAVVAQSIRCVRLLIAFGADDSEVDEANATPLHLACQADLKSIIQVLLDDSNNKDEEDIAHEQQIKKEQLLRRSSITASASTTTVVANTTNLLPPQQQQQQQRPPIAATSSKNHSRSASGIPASTTAVALSSLLVLKDIPHHELSTSLNQAVLSGDPSVVRSVIENSPFLSNDQMITALLVAVELNFVNLIDVLVTAQPGTSSSSSSNNHNNSNNTNPNSRNPSTSFRSPSPVYPGGGNNSVSRHQQHPGGNLHQHVTPMRTLLARLLPAGPNNNNNNQRGAETPARSLFLSTARGNSVPPQQPGKSRASSWVETIAQQQRRSITTALEFAVRFQHAEVAEKLLSYGASAEGSLFSSLDLTGKDQQAAFGVGVAANQQPQLPRGVATQASPLREACARNDLAMVRVLVDKGRAQFDKINNNTNVAAAAAMSNGGAAVPPSMMSSSAATPIFDRVPFLLALYRQFTDLVALLIRLGAAFDRPDHNERRALHVAAGNGNLELCRLLLEAGADVHRPDIEGRTPLFEAAVNGRSDVVRLLIASGASVERFDNQGNSMIHSAFRHGHFETTSALIWGTFVRDRNAKNADGSAAQQDRYRYAEPQLLEACLVGDGETVADMLQNKTNPVNADITAAGGWSGLHIAAACGFEGIVKLLINSGASINRLDRLGRMPIHEAARSGFSKIVILLLSRGAFADAPDEKGRTPLLEATLYGHVDVISALTRIGQPNLDWGNCWTPLHEAAYKGNTKIVAAFIDAGVEVDVLDASRRTPLALAAMEGHVDTVKYLLSKKASLNGRGPDAESGTKSGLLSGFVDVGNYFTGNFFNADSQLKSVGAGNNNKNNNSYHNDHENVTEEFHHSNTPLQYACYYGHVGVVEALLAAGCNVDGNLPETVFTKTALYFAASRGHIACVAALLKSKPSKLRVTEAFATPLHAAACNGYADICNLLCDAGFELDAVTIAGWSALQLAAKNGHTAVVECLLRRNADPNKTDRDGSTAIRDAAKGGHTQIIILLLQTQRVAIDCKTPDGRSALHDAAFAGHASTVSLLIRARAVVNRRDNYGYTPLFLAAGAGKKDCVEILMNEGQAQFAITSNLGQNPLHAAAAAGRIELVEYFIDLFQRFQEEQAERNREMAAQAAEKMAEQQRIARQQAQQLAEQQKQEQQQHAAAADGKPEQKHSEAASPPPPQQQQQQQQPTSQAVSPVQQQQPVLFSQQLQQQQQQQYQLQPPTKEQVAAANAAASRIGSMNCPEIINRSDRAGKTPLYLAATFGQLDVTLLLIDYGADTALCTTAGATPLHSAVAGGYKEIVEVLLDCGASPDVATSIGICPLHVACQSGQIDLVRLLLSYGANPGLVDKYDRTPLFFAVVHGHSYIVDLLLQEGANAAKAGKSDVIKINHNTCTGTTALHVVAATGNVLFVRKLLEAGADPNVYDITRATPLHEVLRTRYDDKTGKHRQTHQDIARILLNAGASVDACDLGLESPIDIAERTRVAKAVNQQELAALGGHAPPRVLVDDEVVKMMRERHSDTKSFGESMAARWSVFISCCTLGNGSSLKFNDQKKK